MDEQQRDRVRSAIQEVSQLDQGQELNDTPDISNSSGKGFTAS